MRLFNLGICIILGLTIVGSPLIRPKLFNSEEIPPIQVQVLDAETGESMEGVLVYYRLQSAYLKHFLGIPKIDPIYYRDLKKSENYTDSDGIVFIKGRTVSLKLYENILGEVIVTNKNAPWSDAKNKTLENYKYVNVSSETGNILSEDTIISKETLIKDGVDEDYYTHFTVVNEINSNGQLIKRKIIVELDKLD